MAATSAKQLYVSASRGRKSVSIYTHDKRELRDAVARSGERVSATELADTAAKGNTRKRRFHDWLITQVARAREGIGKWRRSASQPQSDLGRANTSGHETSAPSEGHGYAGSSRGRGGMEMSYG